MVVGQCQVVTLQFSISVASIQVDASVTRHKVECLVENSERFLEPLFFEKGSAHIVVGQPDLNSYIVLKTLCIHKL